MPRYDVSAPFTVEFVDLDANERGISTLRQRCEGTVEAANETDAAAIVRQRIRQEYQVCWQMHIGPVSVEPVCDEPGAEAQDDEDRPADQR